MASDRSTPERARYEHRQTGWPMLCSALVPFVVLAGWWWLGPTSPEGSSHGLSREATRFASYGLPRELAPGLVPLIVGFVVLTLGFSWLTTVVTDRRFVFRFGIGLVRRSIPLDDIRRVTVEASRWYEGWGIHWTRRGMLYNVGGFQTVAVELVNGKRLRVGSDEAVRLQRAIERAIAARRPPAR